MISVPDLESQKCQLNRSGGIMCCRVSVKQSADMCVTLHVSNKLPGHYFLSNGHLIYKCAIMNANDSFIFSQT